ncbi:hypothetical protein [Candidatus Nitrosocosmicus arcticus]|uniref:ArnR1-like winged helix-turn-helix domain-containing protein n=1 Tax=Candidatus Nitrosocosmicus arcticus TaxID=2035267 RepID=A0A557SRY1_9ARCH|nr:hypothetical protein [Candidatus Nitrosocosmicus arcticus]TVP39364.1 hypothetical protein NARC_160078 [Candidatus Nitrosocosmicus arcticus]
MSREEEYKTCNIDRIARKHVQQEQGHLLIHLYKQMDFKELSKITNMTELQLLGKITILEAAGFIKSVESEVKTEGNIVEIYKKYIITEKGRNEIRYMNLSNELNRQNQKKNKPIRNLLSLLNKALT